MCALSIYWLKGDSHDSNAHHAEGVYAVSIKGLKTEKRRYT